MGPGDDIDGGSGLGLQPEFPDVRRMLAEADDKIKNPPPRPFPWHVATAVLSLLGLGVAGVLYGKRVQANRFRVSPAEVVRLFDSGMTPVILDVRAPFVYGSSPFRIHGALRVSPVDLEADVAALNVAPTRTVVAYCSCEDERTSAGVARRLRSLGYTDVRILKGGLGGWTNAGLPLDAKSVG